MVRIPRTVPRKSPLLVDKYYDEITTKYTAQADEWLAQFSAEVSADQSKVLKSTLEHAAAEIEALVVFCQRIGAHADQIGDKGSANYNKQIRQWIEKREQKWKSLGSAAGKAIKGALNAAKKAITGV